MKKRRFIKVLKWIGIVVLVWAVVHSIGTMILGGRFAGEIAKVKAAGDYVSCSELGGPRVSDEDNAAVVYNRLFKRFEGRESKKQQTILQLVLDSAKTSETTFNPSGLPNYQRQIIESGQLWNRAAEASAYFEDIVPLVREAVLKPHSSFPVKWQDGFAALLPHYGNLRTLDRILVAQAIVSAHEGKMDAAVDRLHLAFSVDKTSCSDPLLIALLVKCGMFRLTTDGLVEVSRYGNLTEQQAAVMTSDLNVAGLSSDMVNAMKGERALGLWAYDYALKGGTARMAYLAGGEPPSPFQNWLSSNVVFLWKPILYSDGVVYLNYMQKQINAAPLPYRLWQKERLDEQAEHLPKYAILSRIILPVFGRVRARVDDTQASAGLAQVLISAQQYRQRAGKYPGSLRELGTAIPKDPFSNQDLIYKRTDKGFQVYSIGENLRDDGGRASESHNTERKDQILNWPL